MGKLLDKILLFDTLRFAWSRVSANGGASGGDGVTLSRFARHRDAHLFTLIDEVKAGIYLPGPPRKVLIRTSNKQRVISILPVRDRILQRATLDVLTYRIDKTFLPMSYGYRPGKSLFDAVDRIVRLRDSGLTWVVDADIADCFGQFDHEMLQQYVQKRIRDTELCDLINLWITTGTPGGRKHRGVLLGAPISPLLCNIYLHHLDRALQQQHRQAVRYADDFVVFCPSRDEAITAWRETESILTELKLVLNRRKTSIVSFDRGFDFLGMQFEGTDYSYVVEGKRIVVDQLPPPSFHYHADGYE